MRSLSGAVLGAVCVAALAEALRQVEIGLSIPGTGVTLSAPAGLADVALAALMLIVLIYRPQGIVGGSDNWGEKFLNRRATAGRPAVAEASRPAGETT